MRSKFTLLLALAFIAFATTQCKKKAADEPAVEEPAPAPSGPNSVTDIIAANGSPANTFTVDAVSATTVTINGVLIEVPANAFVTSSNAAVTGIVTLTAKTILTKSQIIFSGAGANSSGNKMVATKGCVKVTASQNTQSLRLAPSGNFFVNVKDTSLSPPPQKKFYAPKVTATDSTAFWALGTDVSNITTRTFTTGPTVYHHASLDSLKWLNVGVQDVPTNPLGAITVSVNASMFSKANTMVFVSCDNELIVSALFEINPGNGTFRISNQETGIAAHLVAIAAVNGQYYAAILPITTTASSTPINLNMTAVSQTQLQTMVLALP